MRTLLSALGSPQAGLPVAHIAGTKGKGSVTAMLQSILQESGYRVGTYTRHACTYSLLGTAVHCSHALVYGVPHVLLSLPNIYLQ